MQNPDSNLVLAAVAEIEKLQRENATLRMYRDHTERLLALFEGGPTHFPGMVTGEDDFVHQLQELAKSLDTEDRLKSSGREM